MPATKNARDIFLNALDRTPAERAAYLAVACADDAALRQRVEALLRANDDPGAFLSEAKPSEHAPEASEATGAHISDRPQLTVDYGDPTARVGSIIAGKYKLIEEIGEGGMGCVYMAQQTEPVKRAVAIKVIKAGMDSKAVLTRFEAERQALAMMDHPNIARVLDAGTTNGGRPYFVMELVKGQTITKFCDERKLTPRQRLELFVPVCQAIQHAHQKGVIHRDIKPSNVLVAMYDDKPVPKVIDFGVAKAAGQTLTDKTLMTGFGAVVGTPEYMSPEQANLNNLDIDTRSDVYSLGVLLFELLTGTTPVDRKSLGKAALLEILRIVREVEPPSPSAKLSTIDTLPSVAASRGTEPAKLSNLMKGELDWMVLKALEKDRTRRYDTANALSRDIQRYLADEVVEARPASAGYRLRKFVQRNKGKVIAAGIMLSLLLAGIAGTTFGLIRAMQSAEAERLAKVEAQDEKAKAVQAADAERQARESEAVQRVLAVEQRSKAEKARDRTRDVLDAMTSSATGDSLSTQKEISADQKKFLTEVLTYYREFAGEKADDERSRARTAEAAFRVGMIEARLGRQEQALAAYQMARDGYQALVAVMPANATYRKHLALCCNNLGLRLNDLGKRAESEEQYRQALAIQTKLAADFPLLPGYRQDLAGSHYNFGNQLKEMGKRVEAEEQYHKALAIRKKLAADFPIIPDFRRDLALCHNDLGNLLRDLGKGAEAEEQYRLAVAIQEKLISGFPKVPTYQNELAGSYSNLGNLLQNLGKGAEAEKQFNLALAILEKLATDFPAVPAYRKNLASSQNNLGILLVSLGRREAAAEQFQHALAIQNKLAADFPAVLEYRHELALSHNNLGLLFDGLGKRAEATEQFQQALTIQKKLTADFPAVPAYRKDLAGSHNNLGLLQAGLGKRAEAEEQYRLALTILEKLAADFPTVPEYRQHLARGHKNLGILLAGLGQHADASKQCSLAIAILEKLTTDFPGVTAHRKELAECIAGRARTYDALTKHAEADNDWNQAIKLSSLTDQLRFRAGRVSSRLRTNRVDEAVAEVAELTKNPFWPASQWYNFACAYVIACKTGGLNPPAPQKYADRAMELLQKAVQAGYKDVDHMKKDSDLDPLRSREDFKNLLAELEQKFPPKKEVIPPPEEGKK